MKTIIEMAREAGAYIADLPLEDAVLFEVNILSGRSEKLERFAELVRADEREACMLIVENEAVQYAEPVWAFEIVNDIRARGNT